MRLSLMKAAHAVVASAEYRKFGFACSIFSVNVAFASSLKWKFSRFGEKEPYLVNTGDLAYLVWLEASLR
jgi:hypothetical protein